MIQSERIRLKKDHEPAKKCENAHCSNTLDLVFDHKHGEMVDGEWVDGEVRPPAAHPVNIPCHTNHAVSCLTTQCCALQGRFTLCRRCNIALGHLNDDPEVARGLAVYYRNRGKTSNPKP
jgi:hypothetical protein